MPVYRTMQIPWRRKLNRDSKTYFRRWRLISTRRGGPRWRKRGERAYIFGTPALNFAGELRRPCRPTPCPSVVDYSKLQILIERGSPRRIRKVNVAPLPRFVALRRPRRKKIRWSASTNDTERVDVVFWSIFVENDPVVSTLNLYVQVSRDPNKFVHYRSWSSPTMVKNYAEHVSRLLEE